MIRQHQVANLSFDDEKQPTYQSNFLSIKRHFNLLDKNTEHFVNTNDICTPIDCVVEMVDKIPLSFFEKKELKILDPCCGNGNFHAYLSKKTPLQNLFFNDINAHRLANVQQFFGKDIHISSIDFLEMDESKKYDLIVANPPYAKIVNGKRASKNHNMSRDFIRKALRMTKKDGFMLFIVPNNWMSFSDRNDLPRLLSEYQFLHIDVGGAKKYFPTVGSSFSWFLLQKTANKNPFTFVNHYVIKNQEKVSLKKGVNFIPLFYDNAVKSILEKVIANNSEKYRVETSSHLHNHTKKSFLSDEKTADFHFKIIHTPTKIRYANIAHKYQNGYKVFISLTNQYKTFIDNCGMTQSIAFVRCQNKTQAERIKRELDSEIFKFIVNITRYGNFNNIRVLQALSRVNTFQLSDTENETIRKFNMVYYGKKK